MVHDLAGIVPKSVLKLCGYVIDSNAYNMVYLQLFGICLAAVMSGLIGRLLFVRKTVLFHPDGVFAAIFHTTFILIRGGADAEEDSEFLS